MRYLKRREILDLGAILLMKNPALLLLPVSNMVVAALSYGKTNGECACPEKERK